jgi:hypothetical protein
MSQTKVVLGEVKEAECEDVEWIYLAQGMIYRQVVVHTIMSLRIP